MKLIATRQRPTGFSEPAFYEETAEVVGFVFGSHQDAKGYNRSGETVLAVYVDYAGRLSQAPVEQFMITPEESTALQERGERVSLRSTPCVFGQAGSSRFGWMSSHINSLASALAAREFGKQYVSISRVIWAKLFRSFLQVQPVRVIAVHAENVQLHTIFNAAAESCVRTINLHASLQSASSYYTVNETETNHFSNHGRGE